MDSDNTLIILAAPNVSEQMGGEAMKALNIFTECKKAYPNTIQITHERNKGELSDRLKLDNVYYIEDTWLDKLLAKSKLTGIFLNWIFSRNVVKKAEALAVELGKENSKDVIVWQTEPNSPVIPRTVSSIYKNCFGPINGNIYYPPIFQHHEKFVIKFRRLLHLPLQRVNRLFFKGITKADAILCAGGERTTSSLLAAGCPENIMIDSLDCGIKDELLQRERVVHSGNNYKFIHFGRLVFHKGTALIIRSLPKTKTPIVLDIVGQGPELEKCKLLAEELGVSDRVNFLGWYVDHADLIKSMNDYRGFVLPSMEDANGIVVQESMTLGLPAICLDWGGPQLLVDHGETGYLVEPVSVDHITTEIAQYMDTLAEDDALAERMSVRSVEKAQSWRWSPLIVEWVEALKKQLKIAQ
ncbi:MAG: glycosyltransferase [Cellvibrionaceae bacterium]